MDNSTILILALAATDETPISPEAAGLILSIGFLTVFITAVYCWWDSR